MQNKRASFWKIDFLEDFQQVTEIDDAIQLIKDVNRTICMRYIVYTLLFIFLMAFTLIVYTIVNSDHLSVFLIIVISGFSFNKIMNTRELRKEQILMINTFFRKYTNFKRDFVVSPDDKFLGADSVYLSVQDKKNMYEISKIYLENVVMYIFILFIILLISLLFGFDWIPIFIFLAIVCVVLLLLNRMRIYKKMLPKDE